MPDYSVSGVLHEITNLEWMEWNGLSDTAKAILAQNLFVVEPDFYSEFFGRYEWNRYPQIPNFVTVSGCRICSRIGYGCQRRQHAEYVPDNI